MCLCRAACIYKVFTEEVSGGKSDRSQFKQQLLEAYQKKFDLVVLWRLDRFSREGALPTLKYLKELRDHGVNYKSLTESYFDSLGPFGDVIVSMLATIAAQDFRKYQGGGGQEESGRRQAGRTDESGRRGGQGAGPERGGEVQRRYPPAQGSNTSQPKSRLPPFFVWIIKKAISVLEMAFLANVCGLDGTR
ncbi:recombinase family protein [Hymenobacter sp. M29]|uniref:Recombinase family protein n=1 Tax=Hymenobacter mellowenesis TaxID=3063995 RepID=A0ABT9AC61_9BACT|nr:recombinase family protein [Hymenobacter sp. M29]MDO7847426.1 recombinase family protein [Hymenobacter sp. M29]